MREISRRLVIRSLFTGTVLKCYLFSNYSALFVIPYSRHGEDVFYFITAVDVISILNIFILSRCFFVSFSSSCNPSRWTSNEWASSRRQFVESLGHRSQVWSNTTLVVRTQSEDLGSNTLANSQSPYGSSLSLLKSSGGSYPAATPTKSSSLQLIPSNQNTMMTSELFKDQARVIKDLHIGVFNGTNINSRVFSNLSSAVRITPGNGPDQDGLSKLDLIGYQNLLEMMSEMVGEKTNATPLPHKFFSTVCFAQSDVVAGALAQKKRYLTFHAMKHLQDQIWVDWSTAADGFVSQGQLQLPPSGLGESKNQRLRAYVGHLWFNGDITPTRNLALSPFDPAGRETPVFAYIYHCLRIGELGGAMKEIENCLQGGLRNIERDILTCLIGYKNIYSNLTDTYTVCAPLPSNDADQLLRAMAVCGNLYEDEKRKNERDLDPYRESVLNLLSLRNQNSSSEASIPGSTLEDFLWTNLWFIQWGGLIPRCTTSSTVNKMKMIQNGEMILYDTILEYGGAEYFDFDNTNPFNYCTVLLCCHRFGDAISHLWVSGRFLPAIQITVACLHYGLILPHTPLCQNPKHGGTLDLGNRNNSNEIMNTISPVSLFESYFSSEFQLNYPEITVDYLISLEKEWNNSIQGVDNVLIETQRIKCNNIITGVFQNLITSINRSQLSRIVGDPVQESTYAEQLTCRTEGYLDKYLSNDKINYLLTNSAYHLLSIKKESEAAVSLFQLAGKHSEVLEELCNQLSAALISGNNIIVKEKMFWVETSVNFYNKYIKSGEGPVLKCLTKDNKLELVSCFETLLNVSVFIENVNNGNYRDALDIIDGLVLFPKNSSEVQAASLHFPSLDRFIKRVVDDVLVLTVECSRALYIHQDNTDIASGGRGGLSGVLTGREQERSNF